jgi:hypothetical protein
VNDKTSLESTAKDSLERVSCVGLIVYRFQSNSLHFVAQWLQLKPEKYLQRLSLRNHIKIRQILRDKSNIKKQQSMGN